MPGATHRGSTARREAVWTWLCVLSVRCVVYVKGLGETHMTLDRRVLLLLLCLLLLLKLIKIKTRQAGNFIIIDTFNGEKNQRRKLFVVESARRIIRAF